MSYVANKQNMAQLTNIHYWDSAGNAWSGNLIGAATPFAFLPNPTVAGDLVLFGIDSTILNAGPFCSLVFDIGQAISGVTSIIWRYSDVAGADPNIWAPQLMQDNTDDNGAMGSVAFNTTGVNSVHWIQAALWIVQNPTVGGVALGVTGLWICADITTVPGAATPPVQQNRDIYTVTWAHTEVPANTVGGDMDALARIQFRNESDNDFGTTAPELWEDVVVMGLRSVARGADFMAYFNASEFQQPAFISARPGLAGGFVADVQTPSGRKWQGTPPVLGAGSPSLAGWTIAETHATQFYGIYHAYARVFQYSVGAVNTIALCCAVGLGEADLFHTPFTFVAHINDWTIVDLGQVPIPGLQAPPSDPTRVNITIDGYGDGIETLDIYDLILIPVDEWAGHIYNPAERATSSLGGRGDLIGWISNRYLDVDSISFPKRSMWPVSRLPFNSDYWDQEWTAIGPAKAILRTQDTAQRLWFVNATYTDLSPFEITNSIYGLYAVQRYSSMRGAR